MTRAKDTINNQSSKYYDYTITIANNSTLFYVDFFFELKSMQYNMKYTKFILPATGLVRNYTCGFVDMKYNSLYLGTSGGELIVFSLDNLYFKSSFNVVNNDVTDIIFLPESEEIIVSGGDGKIKKIVRKTDGSDILQVEHTMINEAILPGQINSMALTSDKKEIVCTSINYCL